MKNQIVLIICFILLWQFSFSQDSGSSNSLEFSIGPSFPVGAFSGTTLSNKSAGFAGIGGAISLSYEHKLNRGFGLAVMLYGQENALNRSKLAAQYAETGVDFDYAGAGINFYPNWEFEKKSWYLGSALFGLVYEFPGKTSSKFVFNIKTFFGIAHLQLPARNGTSKTDTSYAITTQNGASATGLSYLIGGRAKYIWTKQIYFVIDLTFLGTPAFTFKDIKQTIIATNGGLNVPGDYSLSNSLLAIQETSSTATYKQAVSTINANFGVGFLF